MLIHPSPCAEIIIVSGNRGFYYGWAIVAGAALLLLITNGMTLSGLAVYDEHLLRTLQEATGQASLRGPLKFRDLITFWGSGLLAPLAGTLADRIGVRPLMVVGLGMLAAAYFLYASVTSLAGIYAIHLLMALCIATCGLVINVMLVSRWFTHKRGLAIGITLAGTSLGNATLPPFNAWLIAQTGWRPAFHWSSLIPLALIPVVLFIIRERPGQGDRQATAPGDMPRAAPDPLVGMSYREALRTANFWILALVAVCTFYSILAVSTNLQLHLRDQGFTPRTAAIGSTVLFLTGLAGKVLSGVAADVFGRRKIFTGTLTMMAAGAWFLANAGPTTVWPALFMFGLGWGGLYTLLQLLAADYFGLRQLGLILGTIAIFDTAGGGLGPFLTGVMYDRFGSYGVPFTVIAVLVSVALLLAAAYRPGPAPVGAR